MQEIVRHPNPAAASSPTLTFDTGPDGLLQWFGSVVLMLERTPEGRTVQEHEPFTIGTGRIVSWLERYQTWYLEKVGAHAGKNLHRLYHREVLVTGSGIAECPGAVLTIATEVRRLGLAFAWNIDLRDALRWRESIVEILKNGCVDALGLQIPNSSESFDSPAALRLLEEVTAMRIRLGLIGNVSVLRGIGALECDGINAIGISIYPVSVGKKEGGQNYLPVQACAGRFRLFVTGEGLVYPCLGLVGLPQFAVADVSEPWDKCALAGRSYPLDLHSLSFSGPDYILKTQEPRTSSLPRICESHRSSLLSPAAISTENPDSVD